MPQSMRLWTCTPNTSTTQPCLPTLTNTPSPAEKEKDAAVDAAEDVATTEEGDVAADAAVDAAVDEVVEEDVLEDEAVDGDTKEGDEV